ncbi:HAAS signaling domain-containing protein [Micromonospora sp. NPDC093277]|uniref:HAAS signaling domain-containing protein n=1 Tax=Micromonospora sp. NPDC093277 TaxID=3364291 RepID=UPI0037F49395
MTVTGQEIADYVDRVRAALADLPPAACEELTEDLPEHLAEVAAETDGTLVDRLGTPEAYAAELRAAAGADGDRGQSSLNRRYGALRTRLGALLRGLDTRLGPLLGYASASEFLRPLRPAWWLVRGWLAALLISALLGEPSGLLPRLSGNVLAGLFLLAGTVLASVWLGHRSAGLRGWPRRLLRVGTAGLLLFAVAALLNVDQHASSDEFASYDNVSVGNPYDSIEDVFVYDEQGRLVPNARLFDQNGVPIRLGYPTCTDPRLLKTPPRNVYPYCPEQAPFAPPAPPASPAPTESAPTGSASPTATPGGSASPSAGAPATPSTPTGALAPPDPTATR